jgi:hypothetical protein
MATPVNKELQDIEALTTTLLDRYKQLLVDYYNMSLEIDALRALVFNAEDLPKPSTGKEL